MFSMPKFILAHAFAIAAVFSQPSTNLIRNGGFELPLTPANGILPALSGSGISYWTVIRGSVDVYSQWAANEGVNCIDLNGDAPGIIEQTINGTRGASYILQYSLSESLGGTHDKFFRVYINGVLRQMEWMQHRDRSAGNMMWETMRRTIENVQNDTLTIRFESTTTLVPDEGPLLDNIRLFLIPSSSPASTPSATLTPDGTPSNTASFSVTPQPSSSVTCSASSAATRPMSRTPGASPPASPSTAASVGATTSPSPQSSPSPSAGPSGSIIIEDAGGALTGAPWAAFNISEA